ACAGWTAIFRGSGIITDAIRRGAARDVASAQLRCYAEDGGSHRLGHFQANLRIETIAIVAEANRPRVETGCVVIVPRRRQHARSTAERRARQASRATDRACRKRIATSSQFRRFATAGQAQRLL